MAAKEVSASLRRGFGSGGLFGTVFDAEFYGQNAGGRGKRGRVPDADGNVGSVTDQSGRDDGNADAAHLYFRASELFRASDGQFGTGRSENADPDRDAYDDNGAYGACRALAVRCSGFAVSDGGADPVADAGSSVAVPVAGARIPVAGADGGAFAYAGACGAFAYAGGNRT